MTFRIDDTDYLVEVEKKQNKNTYLRLKEPNIIYITTGKYTTSFSIKRLLNENTDALIRMHKKLKLKEKRKDNFYYFGAIYDIIMVSTIKDIEISDNTILYPNIEVLNKFKKKKMKEVSEERFLFWISIWKDNLPECRLRFRSMKTRWGVCNRSNNTITLNTELFHYDLECLDYVIVHELSHFTHFNHSSNFWNLVSKYCPEYKRIRKKLKE